MANGQRANSRMDTQRLLMGCQLNVPFEEHNICAEFEVENVSSLESWILLDLFVFTLLVMHNLSAWLHTRLFIHLEGI